jgi:hypothetical protein
MASIALTKNAMARMGVEWEDEIGMEKTFCGWGWFYWGGATAFASLPRSERSITL